ncbi:MAG: hypothetical protein NDJ72_00170 [Elusimicrobia bacterium]|nr:hypothetical protein [Elusimicrobiota bacterium]
MAKKTPTPIKHLGLRIPLDLHAALVTMAERDGRSMSRQIIFILRQAADKKR